MKIGILTFHFLHNYGAVLQAYGLQEYLKSKGYIVEIIDYRPYHYFFHEFRRFYWKRYISFHLRSVFKEFIMIGRREKRWKSFETFISNRLSLSNRCKQIPDKYDVYITGSDQIWNPQITRGFRDVYFCFFPFSKDKKKYISYAPTFGQDTMSQEMITYIKRALCNYDSISVRESKMIEQFRDLTSKPLVQVLDPTLLCAEEVWLNLAQKPEEKSKYVLVYEVKQLPETIKIAEQVAKRLNAEVRIIEGFLYGGHDKRFLATASPQDFLNYIAYAECIITTSFHGTAFSLIYKKPFFTIKHNNSTDQRVESLLGQLGLKNRMIDRDDIPIFEDIDYSLIKKRMEILRQASMKYIAESLIQ